MSVDPALSAKRRAAGRKGAAARWSGRPPTSRDAWIQGIEAWRASRPANATTWRIDNKAGDGDQPAEMWIYDEIVDSFLASMGFGVSGKQIVDELATITADKIQLHINSPGGDVFEAHTIYNNLRNHPAEVEVLVDGLAASAASYIAQAGDTVVMASNAMMMIHDAIGFTYGNEAVHLDTAARLSKLSDGVAQIYADRAGGTVDEWRAAMRAETWYDAQEAVDAGLADEISGSTEDDQPAENVTRFSEARRLVVPAPRMTAQNKDIPGRVEPPSDPAGEQNTGDADAAAAAAIDALRGAFA